MPLLFKQVERLLFKKLRYDVKCTGAIAFTADGWTSKALDKYMGMTVHSINKDWELERFALSCCPQNGRSTGQNLANVIDEVLTNLDLPPATQYPLTTDNANNMKLAANKSILVTEHLGCFDHTLQLVVNAALKLPEILPAINACKWLVAKTHYAAEYKEWIKQVCDDLDNVQIPLPGDDEEEKEMTYTKFINSCETR